METFKKEFLAKYLAGGMGALAKRDIDALVMYLLDEHGLNDEIPLKTMSNQEVSMKLRVPVNRIKTLRYEAALKFVEDKEKEALARWKLLEILARAKFDIDADKVKVNFIIEDTFTKNWLQGVLKRDGLFFDYSFNSEVVKIDLNDFLDVLKVLYDEKSVNTLRNRIEAAKSEKNGLKLADIKKEFLKSAAGKLGDMATSAAIKGLLGLVV